ncbi:hypothetical protein HOY82DRAFT_556360, partial [Tuber indicum]
ILDSTGRELYPGHVLIEEVGTVSNIESLIRDPTVGVFSGRGRTLLSGLFDTHTHLTWNGGDLRALGVLGVEDHTLRTMRSAQCFLDSGYTMYWGAASAKPRLDVVIRDAINGGHIPGPRCLANGQELAKADGELEIREVIHENVKLGVDQIMLGISGESVTEIRAATDCTRAWITVCTLARARESVRLNILHGVDVIYHAIYEAAAFADPQAAAQKGGYGTELETAIKWLKEMHPRGITILPGWAHTPATPSTLLCSWVLRPWKQFSLRRLKEASSFMREHDLGKIQPGYYADCILVNGNPLEDIAILQDQSTLDVIVINGRVHKRCPLENYRPITIAAEDVGEDAIFREFKFLTIER